MIWWVWHHLANTPTSLKREKEKSYSRVCPVYQVLTIPHEQDHIATASVNPSKASWVYVTEEGTSAARKITLDIWRLHWISALILFTATLIKHSYIWTRTRHTIRPLNKTRFPQTRPCSYCQYPKQGKTREESAKVYGISIRQLPCSLISQLRLTTLIEQLLSYTVEHTSLA